jgi:hypothetical protein
MGWSERGRKGRVTLGRRGPMTKPEAHELEIGTARRANDDGTWSIKLQIDNIPSEDLADAMSSWIFDLLSQDLERVVTSRRKLQ